ncbi:MAG: SDR family NAD(P)-dependent oxidoreductase [Pseudomonadota bacterium]
MSRTDWERPAGVQSSVAVVGIGLRLPGGVASPPEFVGFLRARGDGVREVPPDRWSVDLHYHPDPRMPGKAYVKAGGFLRDDVFGFDPEPFGISPREADRLDPQQRLLLETTWEALEDAGIPIDGLRGSNTAVFIGGFTLDHQNLVYAPANRHLMDAHTSVGASMTVLSNRLSYTFDLRGPSVTVDTACSSSLVATHLGYEAIVHGGASLAIVGGVNVMLSPATTVAMCKGQFLAPDGRSKTFDASADGYGRGEGAGVVVLKPLESAIRDGDRIYAVLRATGVNQDGRTQGMPLPNEDAQRELCAAVLAKSGLRPEDIRYVEAHGTGTRAGDPVEVRALASVYGRDRNAPLVIGSVKTNIGHLEAAAGVVGLIKAVLTLHHREIFPIRALERPNPDIPFEALNVRVATESSPLSGSDVQHVAVNAFGYGGTNAHAILSEWRDPSLAGAGPREGSARRGTRLVPVSAACTESLKARAAALAFAIAAEPDAWLDFGYTLARRRAHLEERAVLLCDSAAELETELEALAAGRSSERQIVGRAPRERRLLWVFTGMGPQWWAMGQELYRDEPVFRAVVDRIDAVFREAAGWSILEEMLRDQKESRMTSNAVAQPANFVIQAGLIELLRAHGVPAHGYLGHSVGEVAAAYASGCVSLEDATRLAYHRSRIVQTRAGKGTMLAVGMAPEAVSELLRDGEDVAIGAYNSARSVTLSGARPALERVAAELAQRGVFHRFVPVEVAYHSPHMDGLQADFETALAWLRPQAPNAPLYSTAYGCRVESALHDARYWWDNARHPVLLSHALDLALEDGYSAFLEIGPHPVLAASIREQCEAHRKEGKTFFCLKRKEPEARTLARAVAELHVSGVALDWSRQYPEGSLRRLPRYPFQRKRHWTESRGAAQMRLGAKDEPSFFSEHEPGPTPRFVADLGRPAFAYLADHRIQGVPICPGATYVEAALQASTELDPERAEHVLRDLRFERTLLLPEHDALSLSVTVRPDDGAFTIHARTAEGSWEQHARGVRAVEARYRTPEPLAIDRLLAEHAEAVSVPDLYARLAEIGLEYGPRFRKLAAVNVARLGERSGSRILARLAPPELLGIPARVEPSLLDAAFQALLASAGDLTAPVVPVEIGRLRYFAGRTEPVWAVGSVALEADGSLRGDLSLADETGRVVLELKGVVCRPLDQRGSNVRAETWVCEEAWLASEPRPRTPTADEEWLLVGSAASFSDRLARELVRLGARAEVVSELPAAPGPNVRLVFAAAPTAADPTGISAVQDLVRTIQSLVGEPRALYVVTFGAQRVLAEDRPVPAQSALSGVGRVLMTERPELECHIVDLSRAPEQDVAFVAELLHGADLEEEIAVRARGLHVRRLERWAPPAAPTTRDTAPTAPEPSARATAYLRAWHAITRVAQLRAGACILVHGAGTELGRACVDVARLHGVRVVATAGDAVDREALLELGAELALSDETLDFVDDVEHTLGRSSLDAVLAVTGDSAALAAVGLLKPHGRLVSLCPPEHPARFSLGAATCAIALMVIDFERFTKSEPDEFERLRRELLVAAEGGALRLSTAAANELAASPEREAPNAQPAPAAGSEPGAAASDSTATPDFGGRPFAENRTYLVTGGLGGFGLATAEWLVERGARTLVLASRRGTPDDDARARIERLRAAGARVECRALDVTDAGSIDALLAFVAAELPPLGGIVHSAMVLDDRAIARLSDGALERVMLPKAFGAFLLHEKTKHLDLDCFVLYSSISAQIGNPNQAAYAAANAFLDGLATLRRSEGRRALSVSWGAIADVGVVARHAATKTHLRSLGIRPMPARAALGALETALASDRAALCVADMDWDRWVQSFPATPWNRLEPLVTRAAESEARTGIRDELLALEAEARAERVRALTCSAVATVLKVDESRLTGSTSLQALGLDSLMAVELQNALEKAVGVAVPSIELLAGGSVDELSARIVQRLLASTTNSATAEQKSDAVDLEAHFLARICVSRPYFDLFDVSLDGDWVEAWAHPVPPNETELDRVSCAEGARHLALVGSCAVSRRCPVPGKVYYPVRTAEYQPIGSEEAPLPRPHGVEVLDKVRVRARCVEFDLRNSRAVAETELWTPDGTLLRALRVEYHVIPEQAFKSLFRRHARDTAEDTGENPYLDPVSLPEVTEKHGVYSVDLGRVEPSQCLGHFRGYPALPVSIMTRQATALVAEAARRRRRLGQKLRVTVLTGRAETYSFAFAGDRVTLHARCLSSRDDGTRALFACDVRSGERRVATFELEVLEQLARDSGIQLVAGQQDSPAKAKLGRTG